MALGKPTPFTPSASEPRLKQHPAVADATAATTTLDLSEGFASTSITLAAETTAITLRFFNHDNDAKPIELITNDDYFDGKSFIPPLARATGPSSTLIPALASGGALMLETLNVPKLEIVVAGPAAVPLTASSSTDTPTRGGDTAGATAPETSSLSGAVRTTDYNIPAGAKAFACFLLEGSTADATVLGFPLTSTTPQFKYEGDPTDAVVTVTIPAGANVHVSEGR